MLVTTTSFDPKHSQDAADFQQMALDVENVLDAAEGAYEPEFCQFEKKEEVNSAYEYDSEDS